MTRTPHTLLGYGDCRGFPESVYILLVLCQRHQFKMATKVDRYRSPIINRGAVTCAHEHTPHVTISISTSLLRDVGPPRLRPDRGQDLSHGPAVHARDAAQLGESVSSSRWRSGLVRPSGPARGALTSQAGPAAERPRHVATHPFGRASRGNPPRSRSVRPFPLRRR